jgi:hypothetical protein
MTEMLRREITLTDDEEERLRQRARERNISEEEFIQEAVRQALGDEPDQPSVERRAEAREEWQQVLALMRARGRLPNSPEERDAGRGWTREEIDDERFDCFSR